MAEHTVLILDATGRIVWANRAAHDHVRAKPGALLGRNYLEFCPPQAHGELLDLHRRKLEGETVRFRLDVDPPLEITSGPVRLGDRTFLFAVGRAAAARPSDDASTLALLAVGDLLGRRAARMDLNAVVLGALKDDAKLLKGRIRLAPGDVPPLPASPWPVRATLRALLRALARAPGAVEVATGADTRAAWIKLTPVAPMDLTPELRARCRAALRTQGGRLRTGPRGATIRFARG
jgi:hypothetical protein